MNVAMSDILELLFLLAPFLVFSAIVGCNNSKETDGKIRVRKEA